MQFNAKFELSGLENQKALIQFSLWCIVLSVRRKHGVHINDLSPNRFTDAQQGLLLKNWQSIGEEE